MARSPQDVTDAELAILELLWEQGDATIRQLTDRLYPSGDNAHYATVQKLLDRLEAKGCVRRNREAPAHSFAALLGRGDLIGRRLQVMAERLCGGSLTPLLVHLLRAGCLTAKDRIELRQLIDELEPRGKSSRRA